MATSYTAVESKIEETFDNGEQTIVRTFLVTPWSARGQFYLDTLGYVELVGGRLVRHFPARDPDFRWLFARSSRTVPFDDDPGTVGQAADPLVTRAAYQTAVVAVTYKTFDNEQSSTQPSQNDQQEMDLATMSWDFSGRNQKLPTQFYIWTDSISVVVPDGVVANTDVTVVRIQPSLQLVVVRHMCVRKPTNAIFANLGRINKSKIVLAGDNYPPETLRFDSAKASRKYTNKGARYFELSYSFACQPVYDQVKADGTKDYVGWNRVFDPRDGKNYWRYIRANGGNRGIHLIDEDGPTQNVGGQAKAGFRVLFHPDAS